MGQFIWQVVTFQIFPEIKNVYNFGKMSQKPSKIIRAEDNKILREG